MAESRTKVSVKIEETPAFGTTQVSRTGRPLPWTPFHNLRREIDRLFEEFDDGFWRSPSHSHFLSGPFRRGESAYVALPAVDVSETDRAYEITAELPGMEEKNIEVKVGNGILTIKGEKQEEREETRKDYYMRERSFGSIERSFVVPDGVDIDKIQAAFENGVLSVTLPKSAEARKAEKRIALETGNTISSPNSDRWLTANADGKPQLGAYLPASGEDLTVFWQGRVATAQLRDMIDDAEQVLAETSDKVQGTLIAYGKRRERVGPTSGISTYLAPSSPLEGFDAYRAELEGPAGKIVIWANVTAEMPNDLDQGGENIGLSLTPALFNGPARPLVKRALQSTMRLGTQVIEELLNEISKAVPGGQTFPS